MKLTRRKFFAGLAVAPLVAVGVVKALPLVADNVSTILARWTKTGLLPHRTISTGLSVPNETWRQIYAGVFPDKIGRVSRKPLSYWKNHGKV